MQWDWQWLNVYGTNRQNPHHNANLGKQHHNIKTSHLSLIQAIVCQYRPSFMNACDTDLQQCNSHWLSLLINAMPIQAIVIIIIMQYIVQNNRIIHTTSSVTFQVTKIYVSKPQFPIFQSKQYLLIILIIHQYCLSIPFNIPHQKSPITHKIHQRIHQWENPNKAK